MTYRSIERLTIEELRYRERDVILRYMKDPDSRQNIDDITEIVKELKRRGMPLKDPNDPRIFP